MFEARRSVDRVNEKDSYGTKDKRSSAQQICVYTAIAFIALVGLTAGWQVDEIWMGFKISKIFYKLNY